MAYSKTVLVLLLGAASCASPSQRPPAVSLATARDELYQANLRVAAQTNTVGFIDAMVEVLAPTGIYGGAMRELGAGQAAARTFLLRDTLNAKSRASWRVVRSDVSADGRDGYSYGYLDVIRANGDTQPGAFKSYWRKQSTGDWKIIAIARGRRDLKPTSPEMQPPEKAYRSWPMRDSVEGWGVLKATEVAFSDSSLTNQRAAFMSFAAPDAGKVQFHAFVFGREQIGEEFRTPPPGFAGIKWHAEWGTVASSNDLGFNLGPVTRLGPTPTTGGQFFTIWRRQPNGEWKYVVD